MIVVVIIGVLAAMAIGAYSRVRNHSENSAIVSDLKTFAAAFDQYALEVGAWPAVAVGTFPPEMAGRINETSWRRRVPGGGSYGFSHNTAGLVAVSIHQTSLSDDRLSSMDRMIDDGNLGTGKFRRHDDFFIYVVQEQSQ